MPVGEPRPQRRPRKVVLTNNLNVSQAPEPNGVNNNKEQPPIEQQPKEQPAIEHPLTE